MNLPLFYEKCGLQSILNTVTLRKSVNHEQDGSGGLF